MVKQGQASQVQDTHPRAQHLDREHTQVLQGRLDPQQEPPEPQALQEHLDQLVLKAEAGMAQPHTLPAMASKEAKAIESTDLCLYFEFNYTLIARVILI